MEVGRRYKSIQTVFNKAGAEGCLFLSLLSIAEQYLNTTIDFIDAYYKCLYAGWILEDFYCIDQEQILKLFTNKYWTKTVCTTLPDPVPDNMYTIEKWYNPRTGLTHFKRRAFDTLKSSITVKEGSIIEYYCYEVTR